MKTTYDSEVDALSILLTDTNVKETNSIAPGVEVDFDANGRVLEIEFLNSSKKDDLAGAEFEPLT